MLFFCTIFITYAYANYYYYQLTKIKILFLFFFVSSTEGNGADTARVGDVYRVNSANTDARSWREAHTCMHAFPVEVEISECALAPICPLSSDKKMEADISGQFFVRNIHLHEEKRVKNLICKAI